VLLLVLLVTLSCPHSIAMRCRKHLFGVVVVVVLMAAVLLFSFSQETEAAATRRAMLDDEDSAEGGNPYLGAEGVPTTGTNNAMESGEKQGEQGEEADEDLSPVLPVMPETSTEEQGQELLELGNTETPAMADTTTTSRLSEPTQAELTGELQVPKTTIAGMPPFTYVPDDTPTFAEMLVQNANLRREEEQQQQQQQSQFAETVSALPQGEQDVEDIALEGETTAAPISMETTPPGQDDSEEASPQQDTGSGSSFVSSGGEIEEEVFEEEEEEESSSPSVSIDADFPAVVGGPDIPIVIEEPVMLEGTENPDVTNMNAADPEMGETETETQPPKEEEQQEEETEVISPVTPLRLKLDAIDEDLQDPREEEIEETQESFGGFAEDIATNVIGGQTEEGREEAPVANIQEIVMRARGLYDPRVENMVVSRVFDDNKWEEWEHLRKEVESHGLSNQLAESTFHILRNGGAGDSFEIDQVVDDAQTALSQLRLALGINIGEDRFVELLFEADSDNSQTISQTELSEAFWNKHIGS
jgi:hypothetical protein